MNFNGPVQIYSSPVFEIITEAPKKYKGLSIPGDVTVMYVPFKQVPETCSSKTSNYQQNEVGCFIVISIQLQIINRIMVLPTWETFPGDRKCYDTNVQHEIAHAWGWDHKGGKSYVCYLK